MYIVTVIGRTKGVGVACNTCPGGSLAEDPSGDSTDACPPPRPRNYHGGLAGVLQRQTVPAGRYTPYRITFVTLFAQRPFLSPPTNSCATNRATIPISIIELNRRDCSILSRRDHKAETVFFSSFFLMMFKNVSRSKREIYIGIFLSRDFFPVPKGRRDGFGKSERGDRVTASKACFEHSRGGARVGRQAPVAQTPRSLLLSLRKEALQIVAGLPRTFQPYRLVAASN